MNLLSKFCLFAPIFTVAFCAIAVAGTVEVRKSTEPFDAFAVRDEVLQQNEWKMLLSQQQQLSILRSLPINCIYVKSAYQYYHCGQLNYRPYLYHGQQLYIQIDLPQQETISQKEQ